jgi:hypothetical protein
MRLNVFEIFPNPDPYVPEDEDYDSDEFEDYADHMYEDRVDDSVCSTLSPAQGRHGT